MLTISQIERAVDAMTDEQQRELHAYLERLLALKPAVESADRRHSILDITPVRLGGILAEPRADDDILAEMLEQRR